MFFFRRHELQLRAKAAAESLGLIEHMRSAGSIQDGMAVAEQLTKFRQTVVSATDIKQFVERIARTLVCNKKVRVLLEPDSALAAHQHARTFSEEAYTFFELANRTSICSITLFSPIVLTVENLSFRVAKAISDAETADLAKTNDADADGISDAFMIYRGLGLLRINSANWSGGMVAYPVYGQARRLRMFPALETTQCAADVPPILSSAAVWSPIPHKTEVGREEAVFGRTDHRVPA